MAILDNPFGFTGKIGGLSFYKVSGSDKIIVRAGSGPSKEKIMKEENFARTRENLNEFAICSSCSRFIRIALNHCFNGPVVLCHNQMVQALKNILKEDNEGKRGYRSLFFSKYINRLAGTELVSSRPLYQVLHYPAIVSFDENIESVKLSLEGFNPELHLYNPENFLFFRFMLATLEIPDYKMQEINQKHEWVLNEGIRSFSESSDWLRYEDRFDDIFLSLNLKNEKWKNVDRLGWIVALGIQFGQSDNFEIHAIAKTFRGKLFP